ncbi:MAG: DUF72 domain-containing protein [Dokdonella sp.]
MLRTPQLRIGCAGWSIPAAYATRFSGEGTHLQRYAGVFNAAEINSSFYRPHRAKTYARWRQSVPEHFRFSVKMPRLISHEMQLQGCQEELIKFLDQVSSLGPSLGCLLLQMPPSFEFDQKIFTRFRDLMRRLHPVPLACEPRHASWFSEGAERVLCDLGVSRVAADPPRCTEAEVPGGDRLIEYTRLHGSPHVYYDAYSNDALANIRKSLTQTSTGTRERWCIFDNTAAGHAIGNALAIMDTH